MKINHKALRIFVSFIIFLGGTQSLWSMHHDHDCGDHNCEEARSTFVSTLPSSGKWKDNVTPKRDWTCKEVEDLGSPSITCQMCERETIRYAHTMQHDEHGDLTVGCICAGHMEGDQAAANDRESYMTSRNQRRATWLEQNWKNSKKGNPYLKTRVNNHDRTNHIITITRAKGRERYSAFIDKAPLNEWFNTMDEAKYSAFDYLWPSRQSF